MVQSIPLAAEISDVPSSCFKVRADIAKKNGDTDLLLLALAESTCSDVVSGDAWSSATKMHELDKEFNYVPLTADHAEIPSVRNDSGNQVYILVCFSLPNLSTIVAM